MTKKRPRRRAKTVRSISALARVCAVSRSTASRWVRRGCPRRADGTFVIADVEQWVRGYRSIVMDRTGGDDPVADLGRCGEITKQRRAAQADHTRIRCALAAIELKERRESLVPAEQVAELLRIRRVVFGKALAALTRRLVPRVCGLVDLREIEAVTRVEFDALLREAYGPGPTTEQEGLG